MLGNYVLSHCPYPHPFWPCQSFGSSIIKPHSVYSQTFIVHGWVIVDYPSFPWKSLWKPKVSTKVSFFLWTAALGNIVITDNLWKWRCDKFVLQMDYWWSTSPLHICWRALDQSIFIVWDLLGYAERCLELSASWNFGKARSGGVVILRFGAWSLSGNSSTNSSKCWVEHIFNITYMNLSCNLCEGSFIGLSKREFFLIITIKIWM